VHKDHFFIKKGNTFSVVWWFIEYNPKMVYPKEQAMRLQPTLSITFCGLMFVACSEAEQHQSTSEIPESETFDDLEDKDAETEKEEGDWGEKEEDGESAECNNSQHENYRSVVHSSGSREYILHVPTSYNPERPTALIINFHGFGGCARDFADGVEFDHGLDHLADNENFLVAYPQAVFREKGDRYWEPGDYGGEDIVSNDVFFTEQLIANIASDFNVDTSSVYATGYSNGGMMAYDLSCSGSDFIAAAGIMSGIMLSNTCDNNNSTSIIHFHGIADDAIPYDGSGDFPAVLDVIDFWLGHNNIPSSSLMTTELNNGDVVREEYTGGAEDSSVALYTVYHEYDMEGGHVWFSDDIDGVHPSQSMWEFLSRYQRDN